MKQGNICCFLQWSFSRTGFPWAFQGPCGAVQPPVSPVQREPLPSATAEDGVGRFGHCKEFPVPVRGLPMRSRPGEGNVGSFVHLRAFESGAMWSFCHSLLFLCEEGLAVLNESCGSKISAPQPACFGPLTLVGVLFPFASCTVIQLFSSRVIHEDLNNKSHWCFILLLLNSKWGKKRREAEEKFIYCQFQKLSNALKFLMEVDC